MCKKNCMALATTLMLTAAIVSLDGNGTAMAGECQSVRGHIVSQLLTEGCMSPVDLCTIGRFRGDIRGEFVFTATSLNTMANPDFDLTSVAFYTGDLVLRTKDGDLMIKDAGAFNIAPKSNGDFGSVQTVVEGTGDFVGATGRIRMEGVFIDGCVDCRYRGEICTR